MKTTIILVAAGVFIFTILMMLVGCYVSYNNKEVELRNLIKTKQTDNKNEYDLMWKKISQTAQVSDAQKNALREIFEGHAAARNGGDSNQLVMKWIKESVPHVDLSTFNNLQNIVCSSRDRFANRQKELLDFKREHDNLLQKIPSSFFIKNSTPIDIQIVTSTRTEQSFETGKDDDVKLFDNGKK